MLVETIHSGFPSQRFVFVLSLNIFFSQTNYQCGASDANSVSDIIDMFIWERDSVALTILVVTVCELGVKM